ncbi:MAG TPA: TetR/AcrR family transcriptional regulator [Gammaproteobacteria bacterium]|nr:TetR/AcrR family transcriptional regulator [Gammaproteobacteria bacterium]
MVTHINNDGEFRILAAAETLFAQQDFDSVSLSQIAKQAGVSKANILHHFKSKSDLYGAILKKACEDMTRLLEEMDSSSGHTKEQIPRYTRAHLKQLMRNSVITQLTLRELQKRGQRATVEIAKNTFAKNFSRLVQILKSSQEKGEIKEGVDPALVATLLIGSNVFFFQAHEFFNHFPDIVFADSPDRYCENVANTILYGILEE